MQSQLIKVKIKPEKTKKFKNWATQLSLKMDAVEKSLDLEGIKSELLFCEETESGTYIYLYTRSPDLQKANEKFNNSKEQLDLEAKEIINDCWELESIKPLQIFLEKF